MNDLEVHQIVLIVALQYGKFVLDPWQVAVLALTEGAGVQQLGDDMINAAFLHLQHQGAVRDRI